MRRTRAVAILVALATSVAAGALVIRTAPTTAGGTVTVTATADTYTRQDAAATNFGTATRFSAQGDKGHARASLLRFQTSVPAGQQLTKAEVQLTVDAGTTAEGGVELFTTDPTWTETGTTWKTQPAARRTLGRRAPLPVGSVETWDVTAVVPKKGTGSLDLMVSTTDLGWFGFLSREATSGKPALVLTTALPSPPSTPRTESSATAPARDVRLAAVGDMNGVGSYGTRTASGKNARSIRAALMSGDVEAFLGLGDFQYSAARCADYLKYWNKAGWAAVKPYTYWIAAPNHDYKPGRNTDLARFMDGRCPGDTTKSLTNMAKGSIGDTTPYSFDKGTWHIVALPNALWRYDAAGANAATLWLDADLAAAKARGQHLIVLHHDPYFTSDTSAHTRESEQKPWIDVIDKYDVRLTLSGSQHNYERSCPVLANDTCTADNGTGTTAFQVSTGGVTLRAFTSSPSYIVARQSTTHGWLRLVLHPDGSFAWTFVPTSGTFTESGTRPAIGG